MSPTNPRNPIGLLNRISDEEAVDEVSQQTWGELAAAIVATPPRPRRRSGRRESRLPARRPVLSVAVAVAVAVVTVLLVGVTGVLSGRGPTGAQPAEAAILRGAAAALHPSGAIVIETASSIEHSPPGYTRRGLNTVDTHWSGITETPTGSGPQNELVLDMGSSAINRVQSGYVNGNNELYDPTTNTAYVSSNYGPDIIPGPTPGTYLYTMPQHALFFRSPFAPLGARVPRLTITAEQARELRDGSAEVWVLENSKHQYEMSVHAALRVPSESAVVHAWLGKLKVVGATTIHARRAIKLLPVHGAGEYDVAPGTYYPIREVVQDPSGSRVTTTWSEYRVVPATPANEQLLSLVARHPNARVDHSRTDFLSAYARLRRGD